MLRTKWFMVGLNRITNQRPWFTNRITSQRL
jgi:hypothetical protein